MLSHTLQSLINDNLVVQFFSDYVKHATEYNKSFEVGIYYLNLFPFFKTHYNDYYLEISGYGMKDRLRYKVTEDDYIYISSHYPEFLI